MPTDLVITNALVVTGDAAGTVIRDGAVAVEAGRIARVGPGRRGRHRGGAGWSTPAACCWRRASSTPTATPATACSAAWSRTCRSSPGCRTVWKAEGAILDRDTVRLGATLGLAETLLGGVTTTMDMFWHPAETVAAARALGVRVSTGGIFFDGPGIDGLAPGGPAGRGRGVLRRLRRRRRRAARLPPARRLHGRAGQPRRRQAARRRRGAGSSARTPPRPGPNRPSSRSVTAGR